MKRLLVYSYFCPSSVHRPGGVQQVVPALLHALAGCSWQVVVAHLGPCVESGHICLPDPSVTDEPDQVDPARLGAWVLRLQAAAQHCDVVLSLDRVLPQLGCPLVLMSNSLAYVTEATAACSPGWSMIITPTAAAAARVRAVNPFCRTEVVPYGLAAEWLDRLGAMPSPDWSSQARHLRLPHRPDPRKGQAEAVCGLARALYPGITLEIAWLNEPRYDRFRAQLTDMAEHLGIAGRITFSGWKDGAARWDALEGCHGVLQLGSFEETFGLSVIEAVLAGRMALIRPQQAVRDVLGDHPLLLEVADGTCWADIVCDAVPDRPRVAAANRDVRDGLSLSAMVERYDALLKIAC